jgi:hypothetical protein
VPDRDFTVLRAPDDAGRLHRQHHDDHDQHEHRYDELVLLQHHVVEPEHRYRDDTHLSDFHQHHVGRNDDEHELHVLLCGHEHRPDDDGLQHGHQHRDRVERDKHLAEQQLLHEHERLGHE